MMSRAAEIEEVGRIKRVSDQLCSMHSILRDGYKFKSIWLNIFIMSSSLWTLLIAFVDPVVGTKFNPTTFNDSIFFGFASAAIFLLSILQLLFRYDDLAAAHHQAVLSYFDVKQQSRRILSNPRVLNAMDVASLHLSYDQAAAHALPIPERKFNTLKRRHLKKVRLSKAVDKYPSVNLHVLSLDFMIRDFLKFLNP